MDIKTLPIFQTQTIAQAAGDPETRDYIVSCLYRYFAGDYGELCQEDTDYNKADLMEGGRSKNEV